MKEAFTAISAHWKKAIQLAVEAKKDFQDAADECMNFFDGPLKMFHTKELQRGDFAFTGPANLPKPSIMMNVNKTAELVQLFGPSLYHQNPHRTVTPMQLPDLPMEVFGNPQDPRTQMMVQPVMQQMAQYQTTSKARAVLMQSLLNYLPKATDLETNSRRMVDETLIKGESCLWTEIYKPLGAKHKIIGSFWDTVDNMVKDPDAECLDDMKWIARRFCKPVWEFEAKYGLKPGTIEGNKNSYSMGAASSVSKDDETRRREGKTNDLIVYWQIWSKMGLGGLLRGIDEKAVEADRYGRFVTVVVTENLEYLVNLPEEIWGNEEEMYRRCQWETPDWADDAWPWTPLTFHEVPGSVWGQSHLKPGLGELKFINWAFSFMASKMYRASKDFICIPEGMDAEFERAILEGKDYELIKIKMVHGKTISDIVSFMQHPPFHSDFWTVIEAVMSMFEKRTGLTELMYGATAHQFRSAAEADVKGQQTSIRPDDMAKKVEKMASDVATREAMAARWHMTGQDVGVIFGPIIGGMWDRFVASAELPEIIHQLQFSVEAGSAKKKNKQKDQSDANEAMQSLFQPFFDLAAQTGQIGPVNALIEMWGRASDVDVSKMMIQAPPPPPMAAPAPPPTNGKPASKPQPVAA